MTTDRIFAFLSICQIMYIMLNKIRQYVTITQAKLNKILRL